MEPELIVLGDSLLVASDGGVEQAPSAATLTAALNDYGAALAPLPIPSGGDYFRVIPRMGSSLEYEELSAILSEQAGVRAAYVKAPVTRPVLPTAVWGPGGDPAGPVVEPLDDLSLGQGYLGPVADGGIDAAHAWSLPGGRGAGVSIVDLEVAWRFSHEDLRFNVGRAAGGYPPDLVEWRNHGTNVVGVLAGVHNARGVKGICPEASVSGVSVAGSGAWGTAAAVAHAARWLEPGDILLIELMRAGPNVPVAADPDSQDGYIPIEWWPDDGEAIDRALRRGIIVVAAAGNGNEDLDHARYDTARGFPDSWRNPFARGTDQSATVLIGAGAPPVGTHDRDDLGEARSRLPFSNHGARLDAQGWGREVTTAGGVGGEPGERCAGPEEDRWYTDRFCGTSSAAPIAVGALACAQGALIADGRRPLWPDEARAGLRATGSPQPHEGSDGRIGTLPDIPALIEWAMQTVPRRAARNRTRRRDMVVKIRSDDSGVTVQVDDGADGVGIGTGSGTYFVPYIKGPNLVLSEDPPLMIPVGQLKEIVAVADRRASPVGGGSSVLTPYIKGPNIVLSENPPVTVPLDALSQIVVQAHDDADE